MNKGTLILLIVSFALQAHAGDIIPFRIYKENGRKTSLRKMIKTLKKSEVILFGELHNSSICHWVQYETAAALAEADPGLAFAAEMFEADNQDALNNYLNGSIDEKGLDSTARLWNNYKTDYAPLVDLAKENQRPFIASNVPRRYASMVYRGGFEALDSLPEEEKKWIAPLPIPYDPELPGYKAMLEMGGGHGGENFPKAQAVKDATMGYFVSRTIDEGYTVIHFNGSYHSDNFEGILYYILLEHADIEFSTITTVMQENVRKLEAQHKGKANFILCIDENMTPTY